MEHESEDKEEVPETIEITQENLFSNKSDTESEQDTKE